MAQSHLERFKGKVKNCLKECEEAVVALRDTYKEESEEFAKMTKEEEREFLIAAFTEVYNEADLRLNLHPVIDLAVVGFLIPEGVNKAFKLSS